MGDFVDLFEEPKATISTQVLAEFYVNVLKKKYLSEEMAARWLDTLSMMPMVDIGSALVLEGAAIARRFHISYWDAALVAACKQCGADTLYTEDLNHGQLYDDVRAINPFRQH
jgi:predicted nucleic acid-binding protein